MWVLTGITSSTYSRISNYFVRHRAMQTNSPNNMLNDDNNIIIASVSIYWSIFVPIVIELVLLLTLVPFMFVNNIIVSLR